jgi:hypothetical protein
MMSEPLTQSRRHKRAIDHFVPTSTEVGEPPHEGATVVVGVKVAAGARQHCVDGIVVESLIKRTADRIVDRVQTLEAIILRGSKLEAP